MIYRSLAEAQDQTTFCGWKQKVIYKVELKDGRIFYRTHTFDPINQCKRCRKATHVYKNRTRYRAACTLNCGRIVCPICGNPFFGFSRRSRDPRCTQWIEGGQLH